jgi:hypothetical protein
MPQVQRIIDYLDDSLQELEELAGLRSAAPAGKARARRKTSVTAKDKNAATGKVQANANAKAARPRRKATAAVKPKLAKRAGRELSAVTTV